MPGSDSTWELLHLLFKAHPWHEVALGPRAPEVVTAYVEIVPTDAVKYEADKASGYLKVDRPQQFSNVCPTLYGFLPQTLCGPRAGAASARAAGRDSLDGDNDPMDLCILSEKAFPHGDFLLQAIPIGGLRLIDRGQADDKIIAVLEGDVTFGALRDVGDLAPAHVERLKHYFLTYKRPPESESPPAGSTRPVVEVAHVYGRAEAHAAIETSRDDYRDAFPDLTGRLRRALGER